MRANHPLLTPAVILIGAALGTSARAALEQLAPAPHGGLPTTTLVINLVGALILGTFLQWLARTGEDAGTRRLLRLGLGTGVLGGFTTYSTFAVETVDLVRADALLTAGAYAVASLLLGVLGAVLGLALGGRLPVRRTATVDPDADVDAGVDGGAA